MPAFLYHRGTPGKPETTIGLVQKKGGKPPLAKLTPMKEGHGPSFKHPPLERGVTPPSRPSPFQCSRGPSSGPRATSLSLTSYFTPGHPV